MKSITKYLTAAILVVITLSSCFPGADQGTTTDKNGWVMWFVTLKGQLAANGCGA